MFRKTFGVIKQSNFRRVAEKSHIAKRFERERTEKQVEKGCVIKKKCL